MKLGRLRHAITYEAIQQCHAEKGWGICWLCGQVGITRASYYQWLKRDVPKAEKENEIIAQLIQEYDERFHHILGYRRMTDWFNRLNHTHYSRNRIHRLMKALNIHSVIRCKADAMTISWCLTHLSRRFAKIRKYTRCSTVTEGSSIPVKHSSSSSRSRVWSNPCPALGIASTIAQWKVSGEL